MSPRAPDRSWAAEAAKALALLIGAAFFLLLGGELGLRTYHRVAHGIPFSAVLPYPPARQFVLSPFLVFGPLVNRQLAGKQRPELSRWNAQGFRTPDRIGSKAPGEIRIISLGGSTTEDLWNAEGVHWPWVLEQALEQRGLPQVRVFNGGSSAYSTGHVIVRMAFDVPQLEPDFVLVMENINDLTVNYFAARAGVPVDAHYLVKYGLNEYTGLVREQDVKLLRLWATLRERIAKLFPPEPAPLPAHIDISPGERIYERNLKTLAGLARTYRTRLVLLTQPFTDDANLIEETRAAGRLGGILPLPDREPLLADLAEYNRAMVETGRREGVPVIDMAELLGKDPRLFVDVVHYSPEGSRAFGETLAGALAPMLASGSPAAAAAAAH